MAEKPKAHVDSAKPIDFKDTGDKPAKRREKTEEGVKEYSENLSNAKKVREILGFDSSTDVGIKGKFTEKLAAGLRKNKAAIRRRVRSGWNCSYVEITPKSRHFSVALTMSREGSSMTMTTTIPKLDY